MNKFLESYTLSRLSHKKIEKLNKPITSNEIKSVKQNKTKKKTPCTS